MTELQGTLPFAAFLLYCALLIAAAVFDAWKYLIPNGISLGLAGLFLIAAPFLPIPVDWLSHLGAGAAVLIAGMVLFAFGWLGGGDVKLAAAVSLWTGFEYLLDFLVYASLAGGILALLLLMARRLMRGRPGGPQCLRTGESIPYGVAIAPAAILVGGFLPVLGRFWV
jgi:prepilin peptidase CpaA